jgi:transcriptional regulator with XRE-family HTH domain
MFAFIGETVRRLRKEREMTLAELGAKAKLGRGQLSRIENSHQEATFPTMEKILRALNVSRRDFFRRYDLVEAEKLAAEAGRPVDRMGTESWPLERAMAQGAIEVGDVVVLFRVVPKESASITLGPPTAPTA